ncbi:MAG: NUDIX hydrolase [Candidatus Omnitrophica bacterium]|nr:NUDIX hydrolase [Candidatus Omnitrophota bacterium]
MKKIETVFQGKKFSVTVEDVTLPNGNPAKMEVIHHPGSVVIIPWLGGNRYILLHQYRHCLGKAIWEFPAGTREAKEPAEACAYRELIEETGYRAGNLKKILEFYATPGVTTEKMDMFLASNLEKAPYRNLDEDEILEPKVFKLAEMEKMIQKKQIVDAKTILGVWYLLRSKR